MTDPKTLPDAAQGTRNLLLVGFRTDEVGALIDEGLNVAAVLHIPGRREENALPGIEHYAHLEAARCQVVVGQRKDFPADLRARLYRDSIQMFRRHNSRSTYARGQTLRSWVNLDNLFQIGANFYFDLIKRQQITDAVFSNFPHEGSYIILYHLCRLLGIPTVVITQAPFPARIWITRTIEDFGTFDSVAGAGVPLELPAEPTVPFYMRRTRPLQRGLETAGRVAREALKLAAKTVTLKIVVDRDARDRNLNRLVQAMDEFGTGHPSRADEVEPDLDLPFIYFPLHLQPEMTTDTWGFEYADQLLALEELAAAVGDDVLIYVKENPKQTRLMRDRSFYQRLSAIPNARYLSAAVPSFDLTRKCLCVATISGTVGWEALLMGRAVIHYGVTWYSGMPGAFRWQGPQTLRAALDFKGSRDELSKAFEALARKSYPGIIDRHYAVIVEDYDEARTMREAMASIAAVLRERRE